MADIQLPRDLSGVIKIQCNFSCLGSCQGSGKPSFAKIVECSTKS